MEDGEIKESSNICPNDTLNFVSSVVDSQTGPFLGSAEPKCTDQAFIEPGSNAQNDDYYEVISADGSIGGDDIDLNDFNNQNLNYKNAGPGQIFNPNSNTDDSYKEQSSFLDLPFVPKFEFSSESNDNVKELNFDSLRNPDQYRSNSGALKVRPNRIGRSNFDFSIPPPNIQLLNTQVPLCSVNLSLDSVSCIHPNPEFPPNTVVPIEGASSFNSTVSEPVIDTSSTPSVKIPTPDWLDENGDPIKGAFDNIEVKEEASVVKNSKVEYVFSVKEKRNVPVLRGFIKPEDSSAIVNSASSASSLINTNVLIANVAGNLGLPVENQLGGTTAAVYEEEKKLYLASKSGEDYKAALQAVSPSSSTSGTLPSTSKTITDNANKERYNRFKRNRFTEKKDEPETEAEHKEEPKKTKEEAALESQAVTEILKEVQRGAARAKEHGALGWQKCPIPVTNKTFLRNTLVSTLREPYRPPSKRGRFNVGLHSDESQSKRHDKDDDDGSRSSRSSRSRSSSRSTRSYSSRNQDDEDYPGPHNKYFRGRGGRGSWPRGQNHYYDAWAAYYDYQQWYGPEAYGMYYGHEGWPMDPYTAMYYGDPQAWAEFEAYYGPQNPNFRGRGRGMRGRGRGRGWGGFNEDYRNMDHPQGIRSMSREYSRSRSRSQSLRSRSWTRSRSSRERSLSHSMSQSSKRNRSSSRGRKRSRSKSISGSRSRVRSKDDGSHSRSRSVSESKSKKRKHKKKKKKHKKKSKKSHKENPSEDRKQGEDNAEGSQQEKDISEVSNKKRTLSPGSNASVKIDGKEKERKQREEGEKKQKIKGQASKEKIVGHKELSDEKRDRESESRLKSKDGGEVMRDKKNREKTSDSKEEKRKKDSVKEYKDSLATSLPGKKVDKSDEDRGSSWNKSVVSRDKRGDSRESIGGINRSEGSKGKRADSYDNERQKHKLMIVRGGFNNRPTGRDSRQGSSERFGGNESKVLRKERNEGSGGNDRSRSTKDSGGRGDGDRERESRKDVSGNKGRGHDDSRGGHGVERNEERGRLSVRSRLGAEYGERLRKERMDQNLIDNRESSTSFKDKVEISKSKIGDSSNAKMMKEKHMEDVSCNSVKKRSISSEYSQESLKTSKIFLVKNQNLTDKEKSKKVRKSDSNQEKDYLNADKISSCQNGDGRSKESLKGKERTNFIVRDNSRESGSRDKELEKTFKMKKVTTSTDGKSYRQEREDLNHSERSKKSSTNKKFGSAEKFSDIDSKVKKGSKAKESNSDGVDKNNLVPGDSKMSQEMIITSDDDTNVKKVVKRKKKVMKGGDGVKKKVCDSLLDKSSAVQTGDGKKRKKIKREEGILKNRLQDEGNK